jgi:hypothetical protein
MVSIRFLKISPNVETEMTEKKLDHRVIIKDKNRARSYPFFALLT